MASGLNSQSDAARVMSLNTIVTSPSGGGTPPTAPIPLPILLLESRGCVTKYWVQSLGQICCSNYAWNIDYRFWSCHRSCCSWCSCPLMLSFHWKIDSSRNHWRWAWAHRSWQMTRIWSRRTCHRRSLHSVLSLFPAHKKQMSKTGAIPEDSKAASTRKAGLMVGSLCQACATRSLNSGGASPSSVWNNQQV